MAGQSSSKFHQIPDALWERIDLVIPRYKTSPKGGRPRLPMRDVGGSERGRVQLRIGPVPFLSSPNRLTHKLTAPTRPPERPDVIASVSSPNMGQTCADRLW
jgi:hypothetical protein